MAFPALITLAKPISCCLFAAVTMSRIPESNTGSQYSQAGKGTSSQLDLQGGQQGSLLGRPATGAGPAIGGLPGLPPPGSAIGGQLSLHPPGSAIGGQPSLPPPGSAIGSQPSLHPPGSAIGGQPGVLASGSQPGLGGGSVVGPPAGSHLAGSQAKGSVAPGSTAPTPPAAAAASTEVPNPFGSKVRCSHWCMTYVAHLVGHCCSHQGSRRKQNGVLQLQARHD
jgi:hypothetical protein